MSPLPAFSIRETALAILTVVLAVALFVAHNRQAPAAPKPIYLHVYGTMISPTHDDALPDESPPGPDGRPWTRIATVHIYPGQHFGFETPNDRRPAIAIDGLLHAGEHSTYSGHIHFWLDDSNLTFDVSEDFTLELEKVEIIDYYYDCFMLSRSKDPYETLIPGLEREHLVQTGG